MAFDFLIIGAQPQFSELKRKMYRRKAFAILALICCGLACLALSQSCSVDRVGSLAGDDECGSYKDNYRAASQDRSVFSSDYLLGNSLIRSGIDDLCQNSKLFCFPSTLYGFSSKEHNSQTINLDVNKGFEVVLSGIGNYNSSWSEDSGLFELSNGRTVSCSLHSGEVINGKGPGNVGNPDQEFTFSCDEHHLCEKEGRFSLKNVDLKMSQPVDGSYPCVQISHYQLNWGQCNLFHPSVTSLSIENTCNEIALNVYEPFSTDSQFYPCNFSEVQLGPGESVSLSFVFLPTKLGLSSAQFIVQTSSGGFLVLAKGFGVLSPYRIMPLAGSDISSSGWWRKNVSLFNPFDEAIQLEEVIAWVSIFVGNSSLLAKAVCREGHYSFHKPGFSNSKEWLNLRGGHGFPTMNLRPLSSWLIGPHATGSIMDIAFLPDLEGKIFGTICLQLHRTLLNKTETLMVPLEGTLCRKPSYKDLSASMLASVEAIGIYETSRSIVVSVLVTNSASDLLKIIKITEVSENQKFLQIKYSEGLLLFPGSVTQVAVVTVGPLNVEYEKPSGISNCKLHILMNSSFRPQLDIPCQDFFHICPSQSPEASCDSGMSENVDTGNLGIGPLRHRRMSSSAVKMLWKAEADEHVLKNWRNQGTRGDLTLIDEHSVVFPVVPVGQHLSKFITVKNPSHDPVAVQLIMNSGEIVDNCSIPDGHLQPFSSANFLHPDSDGPTKYGFSIAESAVMEAYVHPYSTATLGPVFFHPSNRCEWRSSVIIRNNLSGVEWLSLQGYGGSLSLLLLEGSEFARKIEFDLNLSVPLNISPPNMMLNSDDAFCGCHKPFSKELLMTNNGDLPIVVTGIHVSGAECQLDGFQVHNCKGFSLEPGESTKLQVSYQTDFTSSLIERDLELVFAGGRFVIPMKASVPVFMLNSCRKSIFFFRVKKWNLAPFLAVSLMFAAMCFLLSHVMAMGSLDGSTNSEKNSLSIVQETTKSSSVSYSQKNGKLTMRSAVRNKTSLIQGRTENQECCNGSTTVKKENNCPTLPSEAVTLETSGEPVPCPTGSVKLETSEPLNLTVRTGKDKGRRRKRKKGTGSSLAGLVEVASSHSGASTPSSPMSPVLALTPKQLPAQSLTKEEPNQREESPEIQSGPKSKTFGSEVSVKGSAEERKPSNRAMGRSTLNIRCNSPTPSSTSVIAPHARAPGSKLNKQVQAEEKTGLHDQFRYYDIWGNHFSGIHLAVKSNEACVVAPSYVENDSNSFFMKGPQTLVTNSGCRSVSFSNQGG